MTPTTKEPRLTAAPCTLLISSRPVRETRSVAWTTVAAVAAHVLVLGLLVWASTRSVPITPIDGTDLILFELPEPAQPMPRLALPAAPGARPAEPPRRVTPAARPSAPPRRRVLPPPPPVRSTAPAPAAPVLTEPKFSFEPVRPAAPAPAPVPATASKDEAAGAPGDVVKDDAPAPASGNGSTAAGTGNAAAGAAHEATADELALGPPTFTPFTRAPELVNRAEITEYLRRRYPPGLQQMGIGGVVLLWILLDERGQIRKSVLLRSSGRESLDEAALEAVDHMEFAPAMNQGKNVPVWVQLPVVFRVETY
jgi:protein TonB